MFRRSRCLPGASGAAAFDTRKKAVVFEYDPAWCRLGIELAPLTMPTDGPRLHRFPELDPSAFRGLPGLLADALPDRFGNRLIDAWMSQRGVRADAVTVLDRLAYMGNRGMGALSFKPVLSAGVRKSDTTFELGQLVDAARKAIDGRFDADPHTAAALRRVISVGTSAGGARAKAVLAISADRTTIRSGQFDAPPDFEHWLLKFDGMGADTALGESREYGRIEYAYANMAKAAGITMTRCELLEEGGGAHFMTRRLDRVEGRRIHVQSYCALVHRSYNEAGVHRYEDLFQTALDLGLGDDTLAELFRRMAFNVAAANHDDHTKNFAFLLPEDGRWALSPAYDLTFAYAESSPWVNQHQLSANGKFRDITTHDLLMVAERFSIPGRKSLLEAVNTAVGDWPRYAADAGVSVATRQDIARLHARL